MNALQTGINGLAKRLSLLAILVIIVGLNIYWSFTLNAFGAHFEAVAQAPLLDLQNVGSILSPQAAAALITSYSPEARSLYWVFFILDNLLPPLVFGAFALLWAYTFRHFPGRWAEVLPSSPLVLIPLGVGLFDCLENLCFVVAMTGEPAAALTTMQIGIVFVYIKAAFLLTTFGLTPVWIAIAALTQLRKRQPSVTFAN